MIDAHDLLCDFSLQNERVPDIGTIRQSKRERILYQNERAYTQDALIKDEAGITLPQSAVELAALLLHRADIIPKAPAQCAERFFNCLWHKRLAFE